MKTAEKLPITIRRAGMKHTATTAPITARVMAIVIRGFFILTSLLSPAAKLRGTVAIR